jgi:hypothetical protein
MMQLLPYHLDQLATGSGISAEVIAARGYFSATTAAALAALGFADYQCLPGLVMPIYSPQGQIVSYLWVPKTRNS